MNASDLKSRILERQEPGYLVGRWIFMSKSHVELLFVVLGLLVCRLLVAVRNYGDLEPIFEKKKTYHGGMAPGKFWPKSIPNRKAR
jgi:hypothetical protein